MPSIVSKISFVYFKILNTKLREFFWTPSPMNSWIQCHCCLWKETAIWKMKMNGFFFLLSIETLIVQWQKSWEKARIPEGFSQHFISYQTVPNTQVERERMNNWKGLNTHYVFLLFHFRQPDLNANSFNEFSFSLTVYIILVDVISVMHRIN